MKYRQFKKEAKKTIKEIKNQVEENKKQNQIDEAFKNIEKIARLDVAISSRNRSCVRGIMR